MSSTNTSTDSTRLTGQVKWFNTKAGYGFITVYEGEHANKDIFVHYSSLRVVNSQYRYLVQGEYVDFSIVKPDNDKYEFHAVDVSGVKGGPIMCETRRIAIENQPKRPVGVVRKYRIQRPATTQGTTENDQPLPETGDDGFQKVVSRKSAHRSKNA
jgi:CspA family cold shock protein